MISAARILTGAAVLLLAATAARAEIVVLTSGRTLNAKAHRVDGDNLVLQMRSGGEITLERTLVARILPDEVPWVDPAEAGQQAEASQAAGDRAPVALEAIVSGPYVDLVASLSEAHGVDPVLVGALIKVESNYQPRARSRKGAMGLMQLMPATARQYNVRNPYDPKANVAAGVKHLKSLLDRLGQVDLALAAYNAGEGAVQKFRGIPPYRETREYVSSILALAQAR